MVLEKKEQDINSSSRVFCGEQQECVDEKVKRGLSHGFYTLGAQ